ncbi:beta-lactamase-like protein [Globomyces pollinis-pini]|nr:beta-lactamase-like protein [Globomyces pollinis-pini]
MRNFIYFIVNKYSRQCVVVDACWDIDGIFKYAKEQRLKIVAVAITHYHVDHVGGIPPPPFDRYRLRVDGIANLLKKYPGVKAYAFESEIDSIINANPEMTRSQFIPTHTGFKVTLPLRVAEENDPQWVQDRNLEELETHLEFIHTPGHTMGSQCILVNGNRLFTGDTLFIGSCGRLDFPDSCKHSMFNSLQKTLSLLDNNVIVFPGHDYGGELTTIGVEREKGLLRLMNEETFLSRV